MCGAVSANSNKREAAILHLIFGLVHRLWSFAVAHELELLMALGGLFASSLWTAAQAVSLEPQISESWLPLLKGWLPKLADTKPLGNVSRFGTPRGSILFKFCRMRILE